MSCSNRFRGCSFSPWATEPLAVRAMPITIVATIPILIWCIRILLFSNSHDTWRNIRADPGSPARLSKGLAASVRPDSGDLLTLALGRYLWRSAVEGLAIQLALAVGDDAGHDRVTGDIDRRACHVENSIDAENERDTLSRQPDLVQHAGQQNQADAGHAGRADRCHHDHEDDHQVLRKTQSGAVKLRHAPDRKALHDIAVVPVEGRAQRNGERADPIACTESLLH